MTTSTSVKRFMTPEDRNALETFESYCDHISIINEKAKLIDMAKDLFNKPNTVIGEFLALHQLEKITPGRLKALLIIEHEYVQNIEAKKRFYQAFISQIDEPDVLDTSKEIKAIENFRKWQGRAGIRTTFLKACFDNYKDDNQGSIINWFGNVLDQKPQKTLVVSGCRGTGKTWSVCAGLNALIDSGRTSVRYTTLQDFSFAMNVSDGQEEYLNTLLGFEILTIDDIGSVSLTDKKVEHLCYLLKRRIEDKKNTILLFATEDLERLTLYGYQFTSLIGECGEMVLI